MKFVLLFVLIGLIHCAHGQTYFLNGDAQAIGDDCYQLTSATFTQSGTVWYADQINLEEPFNLEFLMNFGDLDGGGADGICFVLQTVGTAAIGIDGGGLGYLNFGTSLGIEFDTYQNTDSGDLFEDHIAIQINGNIDHNNVNNIAGPVVADANDPNIEDAEDHVVRITWNPTTQTIDVYFDCVYRLSGTIDLINDIFGGNNDVYWGFTAATGGAYNNQTVCLQENILTQSEETTICTGASVTLNAGASIDDTYTWTPTEFLDNPQSGAPICNADTSTSYTVSYNNLCNEPTVLTFDIIVEDLSVSLSAPFTIDCINESAPLFASLNLDLDATYTWTYNSEVIAEGDNLDSFNALEAGTYELSVDVMGVCTDEISADVIADFTVHNVNILDPETLNCLNESIQLIGTYNGNAAYVEWWLGTTNIESGINQLVLDANSSGEYTFIVYHEFTGCPSQDSVTVQADYTTPSVSVGNQDSLSCIFPSIPIQNISIESSNAFSTNWSTTDGVLAGNTNSIDIFAAAPGTYTLTVQDDISGCEREVDVYVGASATYDLDLSSLSFPNIMSANGDGKNDRWYPFLRDSPSANLSRIFETYDLLIYNRWGQVVFESNSYNSAFSAKDLPDSVYYYSLKYSTTCDGGTTGNVEGYIEVLR